MDNIEVGDIVTVPSYCGYLIVQSKSDIPLSKTHWNCVGVDCDTCYEIYSEDEITIMLKNYQYVSCNNAK